MVARQNKNAESTIFSFENLTFVSSHKESYFLNEKNTFLCLKSMVEFSKEKNADSAFLCCLATILENSKSQFFC